MPIAQSLHVDIDETGWLIAALYLTTAVAQPSLGRLVDLLGPRRVYLASLCLVAAAGVFGQLASSLVGLVLVRVLLGVGTSGAYPAAMRIFCERAEATASEPPRFAMGVLTLSALWTTAVGPVIGGVLTSAFGWQSIFTVLHDPRVWSRGPRPLDAHRHSVETIFPRLGETATTERRDPVIGANRPH